MDFDEWFNTYENLQCDKDSCEDAFEAGQQSRQAEIDELKSKIDGAIKYLSRGGYTPNWVVQELLK